MRKSKLRTLRSGHLNAWLAAQLTLGDMSHGRYLVLLELDTPTDGHQLPVDQTGGPHSPPLGHVEVTR